jgi:hypothetical protein
LHFKGKKDEDESLQALKKYSIYLQAKTGFIPGIQQQVFVTG